VRERPAGAGAAGRGRIEVGAGVEVAYVAGAVLSGRVFGDVEIGPRGRVLAPAVRVAIARSADVDRSAQLGGATLRFTTGGLDVCPVRIAPAPAFALRPCAEVTAGVLQASGTGISATERRSRPWVSVAALARAAWEPVRWLVVEVEAGVIAPLFRESFFFEPGVPVYEAPRAALLGRAGLGVRFP
jgi:hypothetical protein